MYEHYFEGPYYSQDLFGPNGKPTRFHKGGGAPIPDPPAPAPRQAEVAPTTVSRTANERTSARFGQANTVLTGRTQQLSTDERLARRAILGG